MIKLLFVQPPLLISEKTFGFRVINLITQKNDFQLWPSVLTLYTRQTRRNSDLSKTATIKTSNNIIVLNSGFKIFNVSYLFISFPNCMLDETYNRTHTKTKLQFNFLYDGKCQYLPNNISAVPWRVIQYNKVLLLQYFALNFNYPIAIQYNWNIKTTTGNYLGVNSIFDYNIPENILTKYNYLNEIYNLTPDSKILNWTTALLQYFIFHTETRIWSKNIKWFKNLVNVINQNSPINLDAPEFFSTKFKQEIYLEIITKSISAEIQQFTHHSAEEIKNSQATFTKLPFAGDIVLLWLKLLSENTLQSPTQSNNNILTLLKSFFSYLINDYILLDNLATFRFNFFNLETHLFNTTQPLVFGVSEKHKKVPQSTIFPFTDLFFLQILKAKLFQFFLEDFITFSYFAYTKNRASSLTNSAMKKSFSASEFYKTLTQSPIKLLIHRHKELKFEKETELKIKQKKKWNLKTFPPSALFWKPEVDSKSLKKFRRSGAFFINYDSYKFIYNEFYNEFKPAYTNLLTNLLTWNIDMELSDSSTWFLVSQSYLFEWWKISAFPSFPWPQTSRLNILRAFAQYCADNIADSWYKKNRKKVLSLVSNKQFVFNLRYKKRVNLKYIFASYLFEMTFLPYLEDFNPSHIFRETILIDHWNEAEDKHYGETEFLRRFIFFFVSDGFIRYNFPAALEFLNFAYFSKMQEPAKLFRTLDKHLDNRFSKGAGVYYRGYLIRFCKHQFAMYLYEDFLRYWYILQADGFSPHYDYVKLGLTHPRNNTLIHVYYNYYKITASKLSNSPSFNTHIPPRLFANSLIIQKEEIKPAEKFDILTVADVPY